MHDGSQGNAMTEIALALAMGFFSILVLALMSMGAATAPKADAANSALILKPALAETGAAEAPTASPDDQIVIYHRGRLLGPDLAPVTLESLTPDKRVVLAFDPAVPLDEVMGIYARLARSDLVVSTLDARWLARLEGRGTMERTDP